MEEKSLADIVKETVQKQNNEDINTSTPIDASSSTEEVVEETRDEIESNTKEDLMNKPVGDLGLTVADLTKDSTTPAHSMSNLGKFTEEYSEEVKQTVEQIKKEKDIVQKNEELEKMIEEKKNQNKFEDEIIEEKNEEEENKKCAINLNSIKIKKTKDATSTFNSIIEKRKRKMVTTSVPLTNSGYIAHMVGFSSPEIRDLSLALRTRDQFSYWDFLYQNIHEKMQSCSIGAMDYDTFLKSTALTELDLLLYGIFCSTYPESNDFPITCINPKCGNKFDFSYKNSNYLDISEEDKDKAADAMRALIAGQTIDSKEFFENSNTNTLERVYLPSSKMIVELRHPTLYNQLYDVIKQLVENEVDGASDTTLNRMPYVQTVMVLEDDENPDSGYIEFTDLMQKVSLLTDLDEADDDELEKQISENILDKYTIGFSMKGISCPICGKKIPDQEVDFRQLLFMIHQIRKISNK